MPDIARMTVMEDSRQTEVRAAQPRADLRNEFFERISLVTEALTEGPCEPAGMARPMDYFMAACGRVMVHAAKGRSVRQLDMIEGRGKVGLVSAMANVSRDGREEGVDRRLPHGRQQRMRSEEPPSELQSSMSNSYTDFCLNKKQK